MLHVARQHERGSERLRQRTHAAAQSLALIGKGEGCAMRCQRLCYAPGDGMIVRDAHDQATLALHQLSHAARIFLALSEVGGIGRPQTSTCLSTMEALVPPKPNEFDSTQPSCTSSRRSRTMGISSNAGSS